MARPKRTRFLVVARFLVGSALCMSLVSTAPAPAEAQTAQRFSVQISGLGNTLFGEDFTGLKTGFGGELQVRFNPSAFSIGAGIQYTAHDLDLEALGVAPGSGLVLSSSLTGFFVEPRYVFDMGSDRAAPYVSGRASVSNLTLKGELNGVTAEATDTGITINAGGGVLVRLGSQANLDLGATFGYKQLGVISNTATNDTGSGTNLIYRIGLAFGIGG